MRSHSYARKLCWMLCSSIQAYRSLKLGLVSAGSDVIYTKTGTFIQNVSSVCDFVSDFPLIGNICGMIGKISSLWVQQQQNILIEKVIQATNQYYHEALLTKAVTQTVRYIISDIKHIDILEETKDLASVLNSLTILSAKKDELISSFMNIQLKED